MLANLFLHYAFDARMAREYPAIAFERYVDDDEIAHCLSEAQAHQVVATIAERMERFGLRLRCSTEATCRDGVRRARSRSLSQRLESDFPRPRSDNETKDGGPGMNLS